MGGRKFAHYFNFFAVSFVLKAVWVVGSGQTSVLDDGIEKPKDELEAY